MDSLDSLLMAATYAIVLTGPINACLHPTSQAVVLRKCVTVHFPMLVCLVKAAQMVTSFLVAVGSVSGVTVTAEQTAVEMAMGNAL